MSKLCSLILILLTLNACVSKQNSSMETVDINLNKTAVVSTETFSIEPTKNSPSNSDSEPDRFPIIAIQNWWRDSILLLDPNSNDLQEVFSPSDEKVELIGWTPDGKKLLIVPFRKNASSIKMLDLEGKISDEFMTFDWSDLPGQVESLFISPDYEWVAFTFSSNSCNTVEQEFEPTTFDVYLANINHADEVRQVTKNCGCSECWKLEWSSDGKWIAYTDFVDGIHQLFVSKPDLSETIQLTNFKDANVRIKEIDWSPNNSLGFSYQYAIQINQEEQHYGEAMAIIPDIENPSLVSIVDKNTQIKISISNLQWQNDEVVIAFIQFDGESDYLQGLYWIDINTKDVIHKLFETKQVSPVNVRDLKVVGGELGYFNLDEFQFYDPVLDQILYRYSSFGGIQRWISEPLYP